MTSKRATGKPRGVTPSLISSSSGSCSVVSAKGPRHCKRCNAAIAADHRCVEVKIPAQMGHRTYCANCFENILQRTEEHVRALRAKISSG